MKVLIVEDERMARENLARTLTSSFPDIDVAGMTSSVKETLQWLAEPDNDPDVIFMDVELSDGDCFEIFRQRRIDAKVIMTTAYDTYAVKAFEAGSIDYLLKPIEQSALARAVDRCRKSSREVDYDALLKAFSTGKESYKERFVIHLGEQIIPVTTSEVAYFYSEDKSSFLITCSGAKYIFDSSLDTIESGLNPKTFFRISRSCIVSVNAIRSITRLAGGRLRIKAEPASQFEMIVARARVDDFLLWLE